MYGCTWVWKEGRGRAKHRECFNSCWVGKGMWERGVLEPDRPEPDYTRCGEPCRSATHVFPREGEGKGRGGEELDCTSRVSRRSGEANPLGAPQSLAGGIVA